MRLRGNLFLLMAAFLWGTTFVAQMTGMDHLGPFTYAASRYFLGFCSLLVLWYLYREPRERARRSGNYEPGWRAGLGAGCIMFVATSFQQVAMLYTTAGKTAFITCLYIILVPIASAFLGKRIGMGNWAGALLAMTGLYFLYIQGDFSLGFGDGLVVVSAFFWTAHILFIGCFACRVDPIELSAAQVGVCTVFSLFAALAFERIQWQPILEAGFAIFYGGIMSAGVAFTLQIIGQKYAEPSHAAIIMSFEAIFGAAAGWIVLGEVMSGLEIFGCILMATGMIVTQMGDVLQSRRKRRSP